MDNEAKNDISVAGDLGYLKKGMEENTKRIDDFYTLLSRHMDAEDRERRNLDKKVMFLGAILIWVAVKDSSMASGVTGLLGTLFPMIF